MKLKYVVYQTVRSGYLAGQNFYKSPLQTVVGEYDSPEEAMKVKNQTEINFVNNPKEFDEWYSSELSSHMNPLSYERLLPPIHKCRVEVKERNM